jgi:hypothetical protein
MKMRRVVVEILVPADEFVNNDTVITAVEHGLQEYMWGATQDVYLLNGKDDIVDFTDEQWKLLKADRGQVQLEQKVYGTIYTGGEYKCRVRDKLDSSKPRP